MSRSRSTLLLLLLAAGCAKPPEPEGEAASAAAPASPFQLQLMTFNTAFMAFQLHLPTPIPELPATLEWNVRGDTYGDLGTAGRAEIIAGIIKRASPDVVVIEEVYTSTPRDVLIDELSAEYPHYVSELGGKLIGQPDSLGILNDLYDPDPVPEELTPYAVDPLNSGLMIFSRFPFMSMGSPPNDADCDGPPCAFAGSPSLGMDKVAFRTYVSCEGLDCLASKGVAVVKLQTPGAPSFVAFTHMQADDGAASVRGIQHGTIQGLLDEILPSSDLGAIPLYLAGDLNTPGGSVEWLKRFHPASAPPFYACGNEIGCTEGLNGRVLTDTWGFETSPRDPGHSTESGKRYDYILHSRMDDAVCMQHVRIPHDAAEDDGGFYSDHKPVLADFNRGAKWCSPNLKHPIADRAPKVLTFGKTDCGAAANPCLQDVGFSSSTGAKLTFPGSFQWFVINQPGSYSIKVSDANPSVKVAFDVYQEKDLSRPLLPFDDAEHPDLGFKFPMYQPPYYIRVYPLTNAGSPDRTVGNINYWINFHQHLCRIPEDACAVHPNDEATYQWPDNALLTASVKRLWYVFKTSSVLDGRLATPAEGRVLFPENRFLLESPTPSCIGDPRTHQFLNGVFSPIGAGTRLRGPDVDTDQDFDNDYVKDERWRTRDLAGRVAGELADYYLELPRACEGSMKTVTRFETTLTYVKPQNIICYAQYDDSGVGEDDHIRFDFTFDKPGGGESPPCESACDFEHPFDEAWPSGWQEPGQAYLAEGQLSGYYVDTFYPNLFEDESDEDDFRLAIFRLDPFASSLWDHAGLHPLPPEVTDHTGEIELADDEEKDADYFYRMKLSLDHRGPKYKTDR